MPAPLRRILATGIVFMAFFALSSSRGADPKSSSDSKDGKQLLLRAFLVPPSYLSHLVQSSHDSGPGLSAKAYLEKHGVTFPAGSEADYQPVMEGVVILVVRQTQKNIDIIGKLFDLPMNDGGPAIQLEMEISAYQYPTDAVAGSVGGGHITFDALKAAGKSMVLLDRLSFLAKSGQRSVAGHAGEDCKTNVEMEPVIGADGETVDLNLAYHLIATDPSAARPQPLDVSITTSFSVMGGVPVIAKTLAVPDDSKTGARTAGKSIAIVVRVNMVDYAGREHDRKTVVAPAK